ncbi:MAG TPA: hypothetical protein VFY02_02695 [Gaiellaceae bacterium]|nr:hypothetical protein [Gaiellaceae bacterium]
MHDFLLLVGGFALTTVAGGLLGYWLQGRAWRHQEHNRLRQAQIDAARSFYEELSRLLDRRLHRMRQLDARLDEPPQADDIDRLLGRYRDVLDEWNDNLNRNLALGLSYFGPEVHAALQALYEDFSQAGRLIEARVREYRTSERASSPAVTGRLRGLDLLIFDLNLALLEALQHESVGRDTDPNEGLEPTGSAAERLSRRLAER